MLDETSLAIGRLQAQAEATTTEILELKTRTESMDTKLDQLLARKPTRMRLRWHEWGLLIGGSGISGGSLAHVLRKILG